MTSVDSGVETGNDSNDSSIVQHENLSSNQITNVTSAVGTSTFSQKEVRDSETGLRIEFGPVWPVGLNLPISTLCPVIKSYNYNGESQSPTSTSSSGSVIGPFPKVLELRFHPMHESHGLSTAMELLEKRSTYCNKIKSRKNHHYVDWIYVQERLIERKMRLAAAINNTALMGRLLSSGVSPNNHDEQGRTPLHLASCRGYTEMVRLLLKHGADPNQRDCIGNTPLHLAAVTSKISVVTLLLQAGTNVLSLDQHGYNPLQIAQTKLKRLQHCKGNDMLTVKEEVRDIVSMLLAYLQKQNDTRDKIGSLSTFCSRLSLSNTSDQVQDDVKDLLANLDALTITS